MKRNFAAAVYEPPAGFSIEELAESRVNAQRKTEWGVRATGGAEQACITGRRLPQAACPRPLCRCW
ncbi:protein of unknown function [Pseudorhizobium banfieldiae]|uniref:Uncharacterized protein n=1 Tax=Pseudorhizobium banfieldiae TaxID=1125847 RepID=L0NLK8_9HYPH|nr:protein of unknown function [Pseudorhizobium banfieldiae]